MLWMIVSAGLAVGLIYMFFEMVQYKKMGLSKLKDAIRKKRPILLLESPTNYYIRVPNKSVRNFAFTSEKEIVYMPAGTLKSCANLGNAQIGHGDLYASGLIPTDIKKFIDGEKAKGKTADEIAKNLDDIMTEREEIPDEYKSKRYRNKEAGTFTYFRGISFENILNFLNTGINVDRIHSLITTLVKQRKIESLFGGRNWFGIAMAIGVVVIMVAVAMVMLSNAGVFEGLGGMVKPAAETAGKATIEK